MEKAPRDKTVDFLRIIGTLMVILAHVNPPEIVNLCRSFDVCLLVLLSGFCYKPVSSYSKYCIKRIKRLCVPAWVCATVTFALCGVVCFVTQHEYIYSSRQIVETYLFVDGGIGLLWVIRIYMLMALVAPGIEWMSKRVTNDIAFIGIIALALIINESLFRFVYGHNAIMDYVIKNYIMSTIAYGCVYGVGMRIKGKTKKLSLCYLITFFLLFLLCVPYVAYKGGYHATAFKYPPQSVYIIFGIFLSLLCYQIISYVKWDYFQRSQIIEWLSAKSFEVYLSHALIIYVLSWGNDILNNLAFYRQWWFRYLLIVCGSLVLTFALDRVKKRYNFKWKRSRTNNNEIGDK